MIHLANFDGCLDFLGKVLDIKNNGVIQKQSPKNEHLKLVRLLEMLTNSDP